MNTISVSQYLLDFWAQNNPKFPRYLPDLTIPKIEEKITISGPQPVPEPQPADVAELIEKYGKLTKQLKKLADKTSLLIETNRTLKSDQDLQKDKFMKELETKENMLKANNLLMQEERIKSEQEIKGLQENLLLITQNEEKWKSQVVLITEELKQCQRDHAKSLEEILKYELEIKNVKNELHQKELLTTELKDLEQIKTKLKEIEKEKQIWLSSSSKSESQCRIDLGQKVIQINEFQLQIETLTNTIETQNNELKKEQKELNFIHQQLEENKKKYELEIIRMNVEAKNLKSVQELEIKKSADLENEIQRKEKQMNELEQKQQSLTKELETKEKILQTNELLIQELKSKRDNETKVFEEKIFKITQKKKKWKSQVVGTKDALTQCQLDHGKSVEDILQYQQNIQILKNELSQMQLLTTDLKDLKEIKKKLKEMEEEKTVWLSSGSKSESECQKNLEMKQKEISEYEEKMRKLEKKIEETINQSNLRIATLNKSIETQQSEMQHQKQQCDLMSKEHENAKKTSEVEIKKKEDEIKTLLKSQDEEKQKLNEELLNCKTRGVELKKERDNLKTKISEVEKDQKICQSNIEQQAKDIIQFQSKVDLLTQETTQSKEQHTKELVKLNKMIKQTEEEIKKYQEKKEKEAEIQSQLNEIKLENTNNVLTQELLKKQIMEKEEEKKTLHRSLSEIENKYTQCSKESKQKTSEIASLNEKDKEMVHELNLYKIELAAKTALIKQYEKESADKETNFELKMNEIKSLVKTSEDTTKDQKIEELKGRLQTCHQEYGELGGESLITKTELNKCKEEKTEINSKFLKTTFAHGKLENEKKGLETLNRKLENENAEYKTTQTKLVDCNREKGQEIESKNKCITKFKVLLDDKTQKERELYDKDKSLNTIRKELSEQKTETQKKEEENEELKREQANRAREWEQEKQTQKKLCEDDKNQLKDSIVAGQKQTKLLTLENESLSKRLGESRESQCLDKKKKEIKEKRNKLSECLGESLTYKETTKFIKQTGNFQTQVKKYKFTVGTQQLIQLFLRFKQLNYQLKVPTAPITTFEIRDDEPETTEADCITKLKSIKQKHEECKNNRTQDKLDWTQAVKELQNPYKIGDFSTFQPEDFKMFIQFLKELNEIHTLGTGTESMSRFYKEQKLLKQADYCFDDLKQKIEQLNSCRIDTFGFYDAANFIKTEFRNELEKLKVNTKNPENLTSLLEVYLSFKRTPYYNIVVERKTPPPRDLEADITEEDRSKITDCKTRLADIETKLKRCDETFNQAKEKFSIARNNLSSAFVTYEIEPEEFRKILVFYTDFYKVTHNEPGATKEMEEFVADLQAEPEIPEE